MSLRLAAAALLLACMQPRAALARLPVDGKFTAARFDPPYDDRTLKLQLKVYDWWGALKDSAVLSKGTKIPIIEDDCANKTSECRTWTVPGDVTMTIETPTRQDTHRLSE